MDMVKGRAVKCEGRFHELRDYLYNEAIPVVVGDRTLITKEDLNDLWDLIGEDVGRQDIKDPYYHSRVDVLRDQPKDDPRSLVPLIEHTHNLDSDLVYEYATLMGNKSQIAYLLAQMNDQPRRFLAQNLRRDPGNIIIPESGGKTFSGYGVQANFGVGTIAQGGVDGGGIRSDAPFLLEITQNIATGDNRGQINLAALVGFWAQGNDMIVSQMQSCKNATFPEGVKFGVGSLYLAEVVARQMGFNRIITYSARKHPIFMEHPDSWGQLGTDFVCIWDGSSKKLGFDGGRTEYHVLELGNKPHPKHCSVKKH